jgi:hypothetical protein
MVSIMLAAFAGVLFGLSIANMQWRAKIREKARSITRMECGGRLYRVIDVTPWLEPPTSAMFDAAADDLRRLLEDCNDRDRRTMPTEDRSSVG